MKDSVLGNASFEKTPDHLFQAAVSGARVLMHMRVYTFCAAPACMLECMYEVCMHENACVFVRLCMCMCARSDLAPV